MDNNYIHATQSTGKRFVQEFLGKGPFAMLNLLKFRESADYSKFPELQPSEKISGQQAYELYINSTTPLLHEVGSQIIYQGKCFPNLIGPVEETWDALLIVNHPSAEIFLSFAADERYLRIAGHRTAALADSRLIPILQKS